MTVPIDIVIPSHGRDLGLGDLVEAFTSGGLPGCRVVVVDSSPPPLALRIEREVAAAGGVYLRGPAAAGAKRNLGAASGSAELIYFTDADCVPSVPSVTRLAEVLAGRPAAAAAAGPTAWSGARGFSLRLRRRSPGQLAAFEYPRWKSRLEWATCTNLMVRRDAFSILKGFDETLPLPVYGEDVDLGLRLTASVGLMVGVPDAPVAHPARTSVRTQFRKSFACGRVDVELQVRHPERVIAAPGHAAAALALFAAALLSGSVIGSPLAMLLPLVWLCAYVAIRFAFREARGQRIGGAADLAADVVSAAFDCAYSVGLAWQAISTRRTRAAGRRFSYRGGAAARAVHAASADAWAACLALLAACCLGFLVS